MIDTQADPRAKGPHSAPHSAQRSDDHQRYDMRALERRMRF